jgi:hypothetical protein
MVLNLSSLQSTRTFSTIDGERRTSTPYQIFMDEELGRKRVRQELMSTLRADAYGQPQIKIWLQKFRNGDVRYENVPGSGRPPLTLRPQLAALLQKYLFASARLLAQHFLTSVPTTKEILQRELELKQFSRRWVPHLVSPAQKVACVEASTEMLRILHTSKKDHFEGIARSDESSFHNSY